MIANILAFLYYVAFTLASRDALNDWLTHMAPAFARVALHIGEAIIN